MTAQLHHPSSGYLTHNISHSHRDICAFTSQLQVPQAPANGASLCMCGVALLCLLHRWGTPPFWQVTLRGDHTHNQLLPYHKLRLLIIVIILLFLSFLLGRPSSLSSLPAVAQRKEQQGITKQAGRVQGCSACQPPTGRILLQMLNRQQMPTDTTEIHSCYC